MLNMGNISWESLYLEAFFHLASLLVLVKLTHPSRIYTDDAVANFKRVTYCILSSVLLDLANEKPKT